jgi:cellulose synthase/poly-beta-1,6-N-acetylglucosamine synthase-like glycosyltransferase
MLEAFLDAWAVVAFLYFLVLGVVYLVFTIVAWVSLRRLERSRHYVPADEAFASPLTPGISILLPAFNEHAGVVESVRSLVSIQYPALEVVVVNDGSTDQTLERLQEAFDLVPVRRALRDTIPSETVRQVYLARRNAGLVVVDKVNGGKADALNAGLRVARHQLFSAIDADTVVDAEALLEVARPFLDDPELTVGSGGVVRVSNGCTIDHGRVVRVGLPRNVLAAFQSVEYVRAFLVGRIPWSGLNALMIVSGAFGLFRRDAVEEIGGYRRETVGEDVDLVMRLHRTLRDAERPYAIRFVAHPVCWTEAPQDVRTLARQRRRWQRGLGQTLWGARDMFLRPRYGWLGFATLPHYLVFEFLSPLIALTGLFVTIGWWLLGGLSLQFALLFLVVAFLLAGLFTTAAVAMDQLGERQRLSNRDLAKAMGIGLVSGVGYPQLVQAFQAAGLLDLARRKKIWGAQRRRGIGTTRGEPE